LTRLMVDQGIPSEDDVMNPDNTTVFTFPMEAPSNAVFRTDKTAIEQLELWLMYQKYWCEHKPSITVSVKEDEWLMVGAWVYLHFDWMSGVSFLPFSDHTYQQAPYQDCDQSEYDLMQQAMPKSIDWSKLSDYEQQDNTIGSQELACVGGACEIV